MQLGSGSGMRPSGGTSPAPARGDDIMDDSTGARVVLAGTFLLSA
jgi:hypothetical protein